MKSTKCLSASLVACAALCAGSVCAQSIEEAAALAESGYINNGGVWSLESSGVTYRAGYDAASKDALLSSLHERLAQMQAKSRDSNESIFTLLQVANAVDQFEAAIKAAPALKGSGDNGCSTGPGTTVTVNPATATADAWAPPTMLGPPRGAYLRLTMSFASSSGGPTLPPFAFQGNYGTDTHGSARSTSIANPGASCILYALAWVTNPVNGCGSWKDAYHNGSC